MSLPDHSPAFRGAITTLTRDHLEGWAIDPASPRTPLSLLISIDGLVSARVIAERPRPGRTRAKSRANEAGFTFAHAFSPPLSPAAHEIGIVREHTPHHLPGFPRHLPGLRGRIDELSRERIRGWAQDTAEPGAGVALAIRVDGIPVVRVMANTYRDDLERHHIGQGRHGFDLRFEPPLSRLRHTVEIVRETDGTHLGQSPMALDTPEHFDAALRESIEAALDTAGTDAELRDRLGFLGHQMVRLLTRRSNQLSRREERFWDRQFRRRWVDEQAPAPPRFAPRALVIDTTMPDVGRDAGSAAIVSHATSLKRLGFEVSFCRADMSAQGADALDTLGIACCHAPWFGSVEELLRAEAHGFDLVYLHRIATALPYMALVRQHQPRARVVYSVADLHHLRLARQAAVQDRPELKQAADGVRRQELAAAGWADAVITHSAVEAALLRRANPALRPYVVPWAVAPRPGRGGFSGRQGVAFIGHFGHAPNTDAALFLAEEVMPLVWASDPGIPCRIAGSAMPPGLLRPRPGVQVLGAVADLPALLASVRMTAAPLQFGAGMKGKVIDSLAAGVPCICTPTAAEGIPLGPALASLVATDAPGLAAAILRLHRDPRLHATCRREGLSLVAAGWSEAAVDDAMREAACLAGTVTPMSPPAISKAS